MAASLSSSSSLSFSHSIASNNSNSVHKWKNQLKSQYSTALFLNSQNKCPGPISTIRTATSTAPETSRQSTSGRPILASTTAATGSTKSLYEVLEIQAGATSQEIKAAYRRLARVLHPDVARINGTDHHDRLQPAESADQFKRVHQAYSTLSDPKKRADYDRALFVRRCSLGYPSQTQVSSRFVRFTRRSWETDQCW